MLPEPDIIPWTWASDAPPEDEPEPAAFWDWNSAVYAQLRDANKAEPGPGPAAA